MAFVQVTLMKFKEGVGSSNIKLMCQGLKSISKIVPGISKFEFGPDLNIENTSMDFGLIIVFENQHKRFLKYLLRLPEWKSFHQNRSLLHW